MRKSETQRAPFDTAYFQQYYFGYRDKPADLFESERRFLPELLKPGSSLLDIGCAVGGMKRILHALEPSLIYTGVDISPAMIEKARAADPEGNYQVIDGAALPFPDASFDSVLTLGTTVHDPEFQRLVREAYRVAQTSVLFDIRLTAAAETLASVSSGYTLDGAGMRYPYVVSSLGDFKALLRSLAPAPGLIKAYGYWGRANDETTLPEGYERLCMTGVLLQKKPGPRKAEFDLPFACALD